jgi:hypothetical protein
MSPSLPTSIVLFTAITWLAWIPVTTTLAQTTSEAAAQKSDQIADKAKEPAATEDPWRIEFTPYLWLTSFNGNIGAHGYSVGVDASMGDLIDASDSIVALAGRLEAGYERFGAYIDGFYADLGVEDQSGREGLADVDIDLVQSIVDFGLMYRFIDQEPAGGAAKNDQNLTLDAYAGCRYTNLDLEVSPENQPDRSGKKDWLDPIIGAKVVWPFAEHWHFRANLDAGGFGLSSDLTWSSNVAIGWDFHLGIPMSMLLGYHAIGWDYTEGSGTDKFKWDIIQHGATLALAMRF